MSVHSTPGKFNCSVCQRKFQDSTVCFFVFSCRDSEPSQKMWRYSSRQIHHFEKPLILVRMFSFSVKQEYPPSGAQPLQRLETKPLGTAMNWTHEAFNNWIQKKQFRNEKCFKVKKIVKTSKDPLPFKKVFSPQLCCFLLWLQLRWLSYHTTISQHQLQDPCVAWSMKTEMVPFQRAVDQPPVVKCFQVMGDPQKPPGFLHYLTFQLWNISIFAVEKLTSWRCLQVVTLLIVLPVWCMDGRNSGVPSSHWNLLLSTHISSQIYSQSNPSALQPRSCRTRPRTETSEAWKESNRNDVVGLVLFAALF